VRLVDRRDPSRGSAGAFLTSASATTMEHQYAAYSDTPLWNALAGALADLEASREITVATAPEYVIGYLCRELAAKSVVVATALTRER
jgi:hypothetical protein